MVKSELIKRSPLRIFEQSINGGLGAGNIGVLASRKGVGKTACLVHIATDKLFQDERVIHVSFSSRVDHIINWYEDIFKEIAKKRDLEGAVDVHDELIKHRVIMNFNQKGLNAGQVLRSLQAMIGDGNFEANLVIFDGYDLANASEEDIHTIKSFAITTGLEIWFSVSLAKDDPQFDESGIPFELKGRLDDISVMVTLEYVSDHVHLQVVKDHANVEMKDMHLKLDPKTLLIAEE